MGIGMVYVVEFIVIEDFVCELVLQLVSMSLDGKYLVGLILLLSNKDEIVLVIWDLSVLFVSFKVVMFLGEYMKFIGVYVFKVDRILVIVCQEWMGQLGGCGEGKMVGVIKIFIIKIYLMDVD